MSDRIPIVIEAFETPKTNSYTMLIGLSQMSRTEANLVAQSIYKTLKNAEPISIMHGDIPEPSPWIERNVASLLGDCGVQLSMRLHSVHIDIIPTELDSLQPSASATYSNETFTEIMNHVCAYYRVEQTLVLSDTRVKHYVRARHIVAYLMRMLTAASLPDIGHLLNRDHTSIMNGIKRIESRMKENTGFALLIAKFESELRTKIKYKELND